MANALDPYREALVIETKTIWPDDLPSAPQGELERRRIEECLHADPAHTDELQYLRLHTGFIRQITVTAADLSAFAEHRVKNSIETVRVNLAERSYDIQIGAGNLAEAGRFLSDRAKVTHVVLITDDHVQKPHAMRVAESFGEQDIEVDLISVEPGEESKSLDVAASLWQGLLELGADRKTVVTAVGGGVVGDLAGFIAATYARGLRFLQVPTSLLAQVDSSVGGKVGINLPEAKNMIGAFLQPLGVLIDTATLATLPANEYRAGLAEVVKYGVILDAEFFQYLERQHRGPERTRERGLGPGDFPLLPAQGRRGGERRAGRERAAGGAELRPHVRPRLRGPFRLRQAAARRGGGNRHGLRCALAERLGRVDVQFTVRLRELLRVARRAGGGSPLDRGKFSTP